MRQRILDDIVTAMKAKDKDTLSVLRMIKGAMQLEEINVKHELNDEEMTRIVNKQIKTRKDSIVEFEKGNRQDLIDAVNKEIEILEKYMPEMMSEEEINKVIDEVFEKLIHQDLQKWEKLWELFLLWLKERQTWVLLISL